MPTKLIVLVLLLIKSVNFGFCSEVSTYIVGGTSVSTAPTWMAALYINESGSTYFCGGNLIDSEWILTAAHCVDGTSPTIQVVIGKANIGSLKSSDYIDVDAIEIYPNWNSDTLIGDVALLHLASAQSANLVTLPSLNASANITNNTSMQIYGCGETSAGATSSTASVTNQLQTASVTYYKDYDTTNYPDHLFAIGSSTDTCFGDSGGPLLYNGILYGITSFGFNTTCLSGLPSGYTDISYYLNWINTTITSSSSTSTSTTSSQSSSGGGGDVFLVLIGFASLLLRLRFRFQI